MKFHPKQMPDQVDRQQPPLPIQMKIDSGIEEDSQFRRCKDDPKCEQAVSKPMTLDTMTCHCNDQGRPDQRQSRKVSPQHQHQRVGPTSLADLDERTDVIHGIGEYDSEHQQQQPGIRNRDQPKKTEKHEKARFYVFLGTFEGSECALI